MNSILLDSISSIHQKLSKFSNISLEELLIIQPIIKIEELNPGDFFIRPMESSQRVGLLLKGLCKTYYFLENGKEHITHFGSEGSFIGAYTAMLKKVPSASYIEALEPTTLITMNYQELLEITKNSIAWALLLKNVAEDRYIYRSEKDRNITLKTALEKYEYFKETHGDLCDRLALNQIALYLNITPATLSRLKNNSGNYKK